MEQRITMGSPPVSRRWQVFLLIWFGQSISLLGSGLTGFAMGVWVYQRTGSATLFTLIAFFSVVPFVIFSPIAGALVDRWDRRWALILSQIGSSITPLTLILLVAFGRSEIWPIYLIVAISAIFRAILIPAFSAVTTLLVPKEQFGRASGLVQIAFGIQQLLAPLLAGVLLGLIGLQGIFLIDVITFIFAMGTLLIVRIPRPETTAEGVAARGSLLSESLYGWKYILARPGLFGLLLFFAANNFLMGTIIVLSTPLILSFATAAVLGTVISAAGSGTLIGSVLMGIWGGPKRRIHGVLATMLLSGLCMIVAGLAPSAVLIGGAAFFFACGLPIVGGCSQAIWQSKVAPDIQGRVFSTRSMIATAALPFAYLLSGPLADYVFEPLLASQGRLAGSVGRLIGIGPGRGIGLLFIVLGALTILSVGAGYLYPRLRLVEDELPDAIPDQPPADAATSTEDFVEQRPKLEHI
jgi:predicted MFS family arabinose efflux permease